LAHLPAGAVPVLGEHPQRGAEFAPDSANPCSDLQQVSGGNRRAFTQDVVKSLSITILVLLTVAPAVVPLLAEMPCCAPKQQTTLTNCGDCCHVSPLPETAAKATLALPPALVAPTLIAPVPVPALVLTGPPAADAGQIASHTPLQAPLRI